MRKAWQKAKERLYRMLPTSIRKLQKMEKQKNGNSAENAYRVVK